MQSFSTSPSEIAASFWRNRGLIRVMVVREVLGRYRGSVMGVLWSFFNPVVMLLVYTFVFSVVFRARWSVGGESKTEFALVLFAGLIAFNLFAECVSRAPTLILSNVNFVKKVVFPLEILPLVSLGSALFHGIVSLGVWLLAYLVLFGVPHPTVLFLPFVIAPLILLLMGLTWALASLGVYLRDVSQFIGILITALMFLTPIFYPPTALPEEFRVLLFANPLTTVIEQMRAVLFWGRSPDFFQLFVYGFVSALIAWIGFAWFQKTRKGFADVL